MLPSAYFLVHRTLFQTAEVAQEACYHDRALADSVYNAALHSTWLSTCLMTRSICPFVSLGYSTSLILSIQGPVIYMLGRVSNLHDGRTCSTFLLRHTIVHDERQCSLSCYIYLLFLHDVPLILFLTLSRFSSSICC
jgi:hypothetical protein